MAKKGGGSGTTHGRAVKNGSDGKRYGRRARWPEPRDRRLPDRGNMAPWFLKGFGSRPLHKRARRLAEVA
jgi:hypothetical protein